MQNIWKVFSKLLESKVVETYHLTDFCLVVRPKCLNEIFLLRHLAFGNIDKHCVRLQDLIEIFLPRDEGRVRKSARSAP